MKFLAFSLRSSNYWQMHWDQAAFAKRLTDALDARGLRQKDLAARLEVSAATVSAWMARPDARPNFEKVLGICAALPPPEVSPSYLAFGDSFTPMDDEERDLIENYRKLPESQRTQFQALFKTLAAGQPTKKKPGARTPRVSPSPEPAVSVLSLPTLEEVHRANAALLEHESVLPIGSKAEAAVEAVSTLLDRLAAALQSAPPPGSHTDSGASLSATAPVAATPQPDRIPVLPPSQKPPDEKKS